MAWLTISRWNAQGRELKWSLFPTEGEALARRAAIIGQYPLAFVCEAPAGFHHRKHKVDAGALVLDQETIDADAALAAAIAAEALRVKTFTDHADFQAVLNQLKTATAQQVVDTLTADLTAASTLGQVKTVVGTYLAKIILVEAYLVRKLSP